MPLPSPRRARQRRHASIHGQGRLGAEPIHPGDLGDDLAAVNAPHPGRHSSRGHTWATRRASSARDALNIAAKAALHSAERKVSVPDVRSAARTWFQADKEAALRGREEAQRLLNWIIDKVIKQKRARGFMVNQKAIGSPLLRALFDAHVVRRGVFSPGRAGRAVRRLRHRLRRLRRPDPHKFAPLGLLPFTGDGGYTDVPPEDLRALRRAILDLQEFHASADGSTEVTATAATREASQQHLDL